MGSWYEKLQKYKKIYIYLTTILIGHRNYAQKETGDITILFNIAGEVDDVFLISDVIQEYQAYTSDGLTLGSFLLF